MTSLPTGNFNKNILSQTVGNLNLIVVPLFFIKILEVGKLLPPLRPDKSGINNKVKDSRQVHSNLVWPKANSSMVTQLITIFPILRLLDLFSRSLPRKLLPILPQFIYHHLNKTNKTAIPLLLLYSSTLVGGAVLTPMAQNVLKLQLELEEFPDRRDWRCAAAQSGN